LRKLFNAHELRVTVDVAVWTPALSDFSLLAKSCDRVMDMSTYNGDSAAQWQPLYEALKGTTPANARGLGLGAWDDGKGSWWETATGAQAKVSTAKKDGIPELAIFRLETAHSWPPAFWWPLLADFKK
jgi:hypothetical protein